MNIFTKKIIGLSLIVALLFLALGARLFWLQVVNHGVFEARAARQQTVETTLFGKRGEILIHEREHLIAAATTKEGWLISMDPRLIENPDEVYAKLSENTSLDLLKEEFIEKASKEDDPYEIIERRVSHSTKKEIERLNIPGIYFAQESWRAYPAGDFASHILGFVGADETGQYGLERYYNEDLLGEDGEFVGETTLTGNILLWGESIIHPEKNGINIVLTIDSGVQSYIENILTDLVKTYNAKSAGGIVIDPRDGRILAMASAPSFNPNTYSQVDSIAIFKNPILENLYEMGSVVKPLTVAAALDVGAVTPDDSYYDSGNRTIDGLTIENYDGEARGWVTIQEVLSQSLNLGAVHVMEQAGKENFYKYMYAYELGEPTGIDLPNEAEGNMKNLESDRLIEYATASFGQGFSTTPIALARALSTLGNGGFLINPYIVEELQYDNGNIITKKRDKPKQVLKKETSDTITRMLVKVVDEKLAGGHGNIPGYSVAAKTGTAQIASENSRGYSGEFMHTFFGYGPAYNPEFLVFYYLERPQGIRYASESLTEPFRSTMKHLFSYFEVEPDRPQDF